MLKVKNVDLKLYQLYMYQRLDQQQKKHEKTTSLRFHFIGNLLVSFDLYYLINLVTTFS